MFFKRSKVDKSKAAAEASDANCRTCHRRDAETDHVFTQSYPGLRAARLSTHT